MNKHLLYRLADSYHLHLIYDSANLEVYYHYDLNCVVIAHSYNMLSPVRSYNEFETNLDNMLDKLEYPYNCGDWVIENFTLVQLARLLNTINLI